MAKTYHSLGGLAAAAAAGVLVAVGMLMLTIVVMVEPAGAAFPGKNGKIAFVCSAEICTMNPNGQGVDNLTKNPGLDEWPAWSPDGKKIAFHSERSGDSLIYTMNANGQGLDTLTNKSDYSPDWQPLSPAPKPGPPNKKTAPKVLSTSPKANAKGVAPKASLRATFSKKMRASSINGKTFKLFKKKGSTKKATLNPTTSLRKGLTYKAIVTTGAKDVAGSRLDQKRTTKGLQQKVWSFTVRR